VIGTTRLARAIGRNQPQPSASIVNRQSSINLSLAPELDAGILAHPRNVGFHLNLVRDIRQAIQAGRRQRLQAQRRAGVG
jgi:queuine/archaeosine tRNA-ribosyltransferase